MDLFAYMLGKEAGGGGSEPTGTIDIFSNGVHNVKNYASADVSVPNTYTASDEGKVVSNGALKTQTSKNINANGTVDTTENNSVVVAVPNTYTASDEGKVVDEGELVAQGSQTITENGTYDTTLIDEAIVNVSGGGGSEANDILFHFDKDFSNVGEIDCEFNNTTGLSISSEQSKFGFKSLKCGSTQVLNNVTLEQGFQLDDDDFTLDFWIYPTSMASSGTTQQVPISFKYRSLSIYINQVSVTLGVAKVSGSWAVSVTKSANIPNNQWHHIAIVRDGSSIYMFVNGVMLVDASFGSDAIADIGSMTVGSNSYSNGDRRFNGYIDEVRLVKGKAVWTDNFIPPTEPYAQSGVVQSLNITENGVYTLPKGVIAYNPIVANISGGVVEPLSVTRNGTYTPPSGVDGYAPVTVNVSGGGGDADFEIDFTKLGTKSYHGVDFSSNGATFNSTSDYIIIPSGLLGLLLDASNGITFEVDVNTMQLSSGSHRRFLMPTSERGLIYRSSGVWAFYNNSWVDADFTGANSGSFFDNCTIKVYVDSSNYWHIYKDGVLVWEPNLSLAVDGTYIGASSNSINNAVITAIRFYSGQY